MYQDFFFKNLILSYLIGKTGLKFLLNFNLELNVSLKNLKRNQLY